MITGFLVFLSNLLFSSEHYPLFIPIGLYFIKRHVWRVKMFHKTVHKVWNLFNLFEQSTENFVENPVSRFSIDWVLFSIGRIEIEQQSRHPETLGLFSYHFDRSIQSFDRSKMLYFEFSLKKFQILISHFVHIEKGILIWLWLFSSLES